MTCQRLSPFLASTAPSFLTVKVNHFCSQRTTNKVYSLSLSLLDRRTEAHKQVALLAARCRPAWQVPLPKRGGGYDRLLPRADAPTESRQTRQGERPDTSQVARWHRRTGRSRRDSQSGGGRTSESRDAAHRRRIYQRRRARSPSSRRTITALVADEEFRSGRYEARRWLRGAPPRRRRQRQRHARRYGWTAARS